MNKWMKNERELWWTVENANQCYQSKEKCLVQNVVVIPRAFFPSRNKLDYFTIFAKGTMISNDDQIL